MVAKIQLLVHAGAASSFQHDDKYRAQAEAYSRFKGRNIGSHEHNSSVQAENIVPPASNSERLLPMATLTSLPDQTTFLDDTQSAFLALESQLFSSPTREPLPKPSLKRPAPVAFEGNDPGAQSAVSQDSENHSHETRSSYLKSPLLGRSPKKRRSEPGRAKQPRFPGLNPARTNTAPINAPAKHHAVPTSRDNNNENDAAKADNSGSSHQNDTTSELPSSYSLSNVTSGSSRRPGFPSQRSTSDPGPVLSSSPIVESGTKSSSQPRSDGPNSDSTHAPGAMLPPGKVTHRQSPAREHGNERAGKTTSPTAKPTTAPEPTIVPVSLLRSTLGQLPMHIRPPEPQVGLAPFTTYVTEKLSFLVEESEIRSHYQPVSVSRDIRISERGCWMMKLCSLPLQPQIDFWRCLQRMIGEEAIAGWGVWASRESTDDSSLGIVRVYCWGEIVKHVYLLLFVASLSKVRKLGLQWVDAEDNVVVRMRGQNNP